MKEYDSEKWSLIAYECYLMGDIENFFEENPIVGKTIKNIYFIGYSGYNDSYDIREKCAWHYGEHDDALYQKYLVWANIPDDFEVDRRVEINAPIVIQFTDGTSIEIMNSDYSYKTTNNCPNGFKISVNEITHYPKQEMEDNGTNIDANVMFSVCLGKKIAGVESIPSTPDDDDIEKLILRLSDGNGILITVVYDEGCSHNGLECVDKDNKTLMITFGELKPGMILDDGEELEEI